MFFFKECGNTITYLQNNLTWGIYNLEIFPAVKLCFCKTSCASVAEWILHFSLLFLLCVLMEPVLVLDKKKMFTCFQVIGFFLFHIPLVCPVPWFSGFRHLSGFVMVRLYAMVVFSCSSEYFFLTLFWHFQSGSERQLVTLLASFDRYVAMSLAWYGLDWTGVVGRSIDIAWH